MKVKLEQMFPSIFISHGSPALCLSCSESSEFLKRLPLLFNKPKYIIMISAHWATKDLRIMSNPKPNKINDFYGFPAELYEMSYPIKNDLIKVEEVIKAFNKAGIEVSKDEEHEGYDHGICAPLSLMYPDADITVVQISLPVYCDARKLIEIGEVMYSLREEALIIGSGTLTHNLAKSHRDMNAPIDKYAKEFRDWIVEKAKKGDVETLCDFIQKAPKLTENHPTLEHLLPLFIVLGTSKDKKAKVLNNVFMYGNQAMDCLVFDN